MTTTSPLPTITDDEEVWFAYEEWNLRPTDEERAAIDAEYNGSPTEQRFGDKYRLYAAGRWAFFSQLPLDVVNRVVAFEMIENWSDASHAIHRAAREDADLAAMLEAAKAACPDPAEAA